MPVESSEFLLFRDYSIGDLPSQGSGSVLAARSSIENFISRPFSRRDSGSAFMSQYWRVEGGVLIVVLDVEIIDLAISTF